MKRQARRDNTSFSLETVPQLWILTPTASSAVLSGFNAGQTPEELEGFYTLGSSLNTQIIVVHQLPCTAETLWLRVLGRGRVQKEAIDELEALSENNPFRQRALELLYTLQKSLKLKQEIEPEDRELIMRLEPLYQQEKEKLVRDAEERGEERGEERTQREIAANLHSMGMGIEQIAQATGLSLEEITKLTNNDE
jgi:predicted transposase/invertase (TIGR01784 family)